MNGPVTLLLVALIVGLIAVAVRIGSVERRQRLRREARLQRRSQAEWEAMQRELAPSWQRRRR